MSSQRRSQASDPALRVEAVTLRPQHHTLVKQ